jgi:hypothetical protein
MEYEIHEAADLFPLMVDARFDELVEDIGENGLIYSYRSLRRQNPRRAQSLSRLQGRQCRAEI